MSADKPKFREFWVAPKLIEPIDPVEPAYFYAYDLPGNPKRIKIHVIEYRALQAEREAAAKLVEHFQFILGCAYNLLQPDKPVHKGLDPTFYHTLTYEGDVELLEKYQAAKLALAEYRKERGDG